MSAALHSLMRDVPRVTPRRRQASGPLHFIGIGAGGALGFVVLSSALIGLHTGLPDWLVNMASYAALILPVYMLHHRYSFDSEAAHIQALPRYLVVQAMAVILVALFGFALHSTLAMPTPIASSLVIGLTSMGSYLMLRSWAFVRRQLGGLVTT